MVGRGVPCTYLAFFCVVLFHCVSVSTGDYCTTSDSGDYFGYSSTYCTYGCCGYSPHQYCCSVDVGVIVGSVFGAIAGISLLVTLICCCIRHQGQRGVVIRAAAQQGPHNNVFVTHTATSSQNATTYYPGYSMGTQPPPYVYTNPPAYSAPGSSDPSSAASNNVKS